VAAREDTSALEAIRKENNLPGLAGARFPLTGQYDIATQVAGVRRQGNETKMTVHDKLHLGSLTKAMTATLVAMLIEDPKNNLTWDTTIPAAYPHLTNISAAHRNTTLAMLGAHYSGINDRTLAEAELPLFIEMANQTITPTEGRARLAAAAFALPPLTVPGTAWDYSNAGYMLLGHLLDTHNPCGGWERLVRRALWRPLGMDGCGLGPVPVRAPTFLDQPWPHVPGNGTPPVPLFPDARADNPPALGPAGTAHCTMASYGRFLSLHLRGLLGEDTVLLPAKAFERLHTPFVPVGGAKAEIKYAPGAWITQEDKRVGGKYLLHDGSNTFNYAYGLLAPGRKEAYFAGTNVGGKNGSAGANDVLVGFFNNSLGF
jgi:D-alanyl-D-alanine carboxypeptidase